MMRGAMRTRTWGRATRHARPQLIMFAALPWGGHPQRGHEFAVRLAEAFEVYYVQPPGLRRAAVATAPEFGVTSAQPGLTIVEWEIPGVEALPSWVGLPSRSYDRVCKELRESLTRHPGPRVLWLDPAASVRAMGKCGEDLSVYDCADLDWTFTRWPWRRRLFRRWEAELARRADVVLCSSHGVHDVLYGRRSGVHLVPNACSQWHLEVDAETPERRHCLTKDQPTIGFIGGVHPRSIATDFLLAAARRQPLWRLVLMGSCSPAMRRVLRQAPNIHLPGPQDHAALHRHLAQFDVCLIPYLVGGQIDYVYPKKLHEYFAAGKPVVATDMPELRRFEGIVKIGRTPEEFIARITECLEENADPVLSSRLIAERRAVAQANTWEKRVEQVLAILHAELKSHGLLHGLRQGVACHD